MARKEKQKNAETETTPGENAPAQIQIRGRKTKKTYTFQRIKDRDGLVDLLLSPPELNRSEAHAVMSLIRTAIDEENARYEQLKKSGINSPQRPTVVELPINALRADSSFSRETLIDWAHVADIGAEFDQKAYGNATVHARRVVDKNGKFLYYSFTLIDWTHRLVLAVDNGYGHVPCAVSIVGDVSESARIMSAINNGTRKMNPTDTMRTRIVGEDETIKKLRKILDEYGFESKGTTKPANEHGVVSLPKLEKIYKQYGEDVVYRVLDLLTTSRFVGWSSQPNACIPDMLHGLAMVVQAEKAGFMPTAVLTHILETNSPDSIINQKENELSTRAAEDIYGSPVSDTSEEGRAKRIFCVFMKQLELRLKAGKLQMRHQHLEDFKYLRNAYYRFRRAARKTAKDKVIAAVNAVRKRLYDAGAGDYWFKPENPPVVSKSFTR
jgi:hypothetical protein